MEEQDIQGAPETTDTPAEPAAEEPQPETTPEPAPAEEAAIDPNSPEAKHWQAAYTKSMQGYAEERRSMKEKMEMLESEVRSLRGGEKPPPEEEPTTSALDQALRKTKTYRDLDERARRAEQELATLRVSAVAQEVRAKNPDIGEDAGSFIDWLMERPGIAAEMRAGRMTEKAAIGAFRAENPAKGRRGVAAPARRPIPKVEGASAPSGAARDIRAVAKERGISHFEAAVLEAKRDLARAGEAG